MRAEGTFTVASFTPAAIDSPSPVTTALPVGVAVIEKRFSGAVEGRSSTIFTSAFDQATGVGTYVAMESFDGSLDGAAGTFVFVHAASTTGTDRTNTWFLIVPSSGTGALAGIRGTGELVIDADGTHRMAFDYELD